MAYWGDSAVQIRTGRLSLDAAAAYLRARGWAVLAWYLLAIAPLLGASWLWIDTVAAQDRAGLRWASWLVVAAMLWRWAGLTLVQEKVMRDLGQAVLRSSWRRMLVIVLTRLTMHVGMIWGGWLVLPGVFCFYVSGFVAPAMLASEHPGGAVLRHVAELVARSFRLLARHAAMLSILFVVTAICLLCAQGVLVAVILPSLLGVDTTDLWLSMSHVAWWLFSLLLLLLLFDLYWSVGAVFLIEQLMARRTGSDLAARLVQLKETPL